MDEKKDYNQSAHIPLLLTLIFLAIVLVAVNIYSNQPTGQTIFEPDTPNECTASNISAVWESIFKEPSSGITIINNSDLSTLRCDIYLAYKNKSGGELFLLTGTDTDILSLKVVSAIHGLFKQNYIDYIHNIQPPEITLLNLDAQDLIPNLTENPTHPATETAAKELYESDFKMLANDKTWEFENSDIADVYSFTEISENNIEMGLVIVNYSLEQFFFTKSTGTVGCTPSWTKQTTSCTINETKIEYYTDTNNCGTNTDKPGNNTITCDYNSNKIIGTLSSVDVSRINLSIEIDNENLNNSVVYTGENNIELLDGNITVVEFNWDFDDEPLDLFEIEMEKQSSSSSFGYLIVEGIDAEKTIKVEKLNSSSASVCVKDSSISSINSISGDCLGTKEYLVPCPGSNGNYSCAISSGMFVISGLEHSAAMEYLDYIPSATNTNCSPNWNCSAWSNCTNNIQTRTCIDENSCNNNSAKPAESESCGTVCTPNWDCSEWSPEICPKDESQSRTCTDLNACGILSGKPPASRTCTYEKSSAFMIFIIVIIILAILVSVGFILVKFLKGPSTPGTPGSTQPPAPSMPPSMPPAAMYPTMQRRPVIQQRRPVMPRPQATRIPPQNPPRIPPRAF